MKAFIIQPMKGRDDYDILKEREEIKAIASKHFKQDIEIIDSFIDSITERKKNIPLQYLGKCIEMLSDADIVLLTDGWENARGCKIEFQCVIEYKIPYYFVNPHSNIDHAIK